MARTGRLLQSTADYGCLPRFSTGVDRTNAARRLLPGFGLGAGQVAEVRGYSDQKLLDAKEPESPKNRLAGSEVWVGVSRKHVIPSTLGAGRCLFTDGTSLDCAVGHADVLRLVNEAGPAASARSS
jgi:hypothetical protein